MMSVATEVLLMTLIASYPAPARGPLTVCRENPRYFTDGTGRAVYLTGSHTWNNLKDMGPTDPPEEFDFDAYLDMLVRLNHNFIRMWTWELTQYVYKRDGGMRYCRPFPWPRTGPGNALDGKPKFDLSRFDQSYFDRLRERVVAAGKRGIYVSIMLFEGHGIQCSDPPWCWDGHPFNVANNINGINGDPDGDGRGTNIMTLDLPDVLRVQEAYVRKVIDTVNDLDNVLYEITNEAGPYSTQWQYHMIDFIHEYERRKPKQHPVGMTFQYSGGSNATLFASPAEWISPNPEGGYRDDPPVADGSKVVLNDTDHLWGIGGNQAWVWKSFLRGYNPIFMDPYRQIGLFSPERPGGAMDPHWDPVRRSMGYTRRFAERINLVKARPLPELTSTGYCLADPGTEYLAYLPNGGEVTMNLSAARSPLLAEWFNPTTGETVHAPVAHPDAQCKLSAPFTGDAVLYLKAASSQELPVRSERRVSFVPPQPIGPDFRLSVSPNKRYLADQRGQPFFWLGDTAWALFSTLTLEEAEEYLENRRAKGFNVIQCVIAHWHSADLRPNVEGQKPWIDNNPATPNDAYFKTVDAVVELARKKGIVVGLLPAWGTFVVRSKTLTTANARTYGKWLGSRYRDVPNIVWILGGDEPPTGFEDVFRELAAGLKEGDGGRHLITYHPRGGQQSSHYLHNEPWLDFNMMQSGHVMDLPNYRMILEDYARTPVKPTLDGEPRYENIINGLKAEGPRINAHQVRKAAYNAVLSGAAGHTYGCNGIFQFYTPGGDAYWKPDIHWRQAMDLPGASHMGVLKAFVLAHGWPDLVPDPTLVVRGQGSGGTYVPAARSSDATFACAYVPEGQAIGVNLGALNAPFADVAWFDPREGTYHPVGRFPCQGFGTFSPPPPNPDPDYVLVIQGSGPDTTPPHVARVLAMRDPRRVVILFSKPVQEASATNLANYRIDRSVRVTAATLSVDGRVVTLTTSPLSEGHTYTLTVNNVADRSPRRNVIAANTLVQFTFTAAPKLERTALEVLYAFDESEGNTIRNKASRQDELNLTVADPASIEWSDNGLIVKSPCLIASQLPATRLAEACRTSQAITIEAWIVPSNAEQDGPARIVTLSENTSSRNFTLGQSKSAFIARLRTTVTGPNGVPDVVAPDTVRAGALTHVVYTRDEAGIATTYVDGVPRVVAAVAGDLSNWSPTFRLALANELTRDRPWLGEYRLVAVYSRAMDRETVLEHFLAGPEAGQE